MRTSGEVNPYRTKINDFKGRLFDSHTYGRPLESDELQALLRAETVFLEIGSGSGGHLIERARRNPCTNWIGVERRFKRAVRTIEKASALGVENVFVVRADIKDLLPVVPKETLDGIYLLFPDPWPKPRHWKNRFFCEPNLSTLHPLLKPGSNIFFKTDHRQYFQWAIEELKKQNHFNLLEHCPDIYQKRDSRDEIRSEFEDLFLSKDEPVAEIILRKETRI